MTEIRYEGVRFSDGSVALRRIDPDPCERATRTFEGVTECNEELGRHEVIRWLVDASFEIRAGERSRLSGEPWATPATVRPFGFIEVPYTRPLTRHRFKLGAPMLAARCGCPGCDKAASFDTPQPSGYEPTEETDEP